MKLFKKKRCDPYRWNSNAKLVGKVVACRRICVITKFKNVHSKTEGMGDVMVSIRDIWADVCLRVYLPFNLRY